MIILNAEELSIGPRDTAMLRPFPLHGKLSYYRFIKTSFAG
jgi:hypothetical protein